MPRTMKLTETNWFTEMPGLPVGPEGKPFNQMRLWKGRMSDGVAVLCWIPEYISVDAFDDAQAHFPDHLHSQARRPTLRQPRMKLLRANKLKGGN